MQRDESDSSLGLSMLVFERDINGTMPKRECEMVHLPSGSLAYPRGRYLVADRDCKRQGEL